MSYRGADLARRIPLQTTGCPEPRLETKTFDVREVANDVRVLEESKTASHRHIREIREGLLGGVGGTLADLAIAHRTRMAAEVRNLILLFRLIG